MRGATRLRALLFLSSCVFKDFEEAWEQCVYKHTLCLWHLLVFLLCWMKKTELLLEWENSTVWDSYHHPLAILGSLPGTRGLSLKLIVLLSTPKARKGNSIAVLDCGNKSTQNLSFFSAHVIRYRCSGSAVSFHVMTQKPGLFHTVALLLSRALSSLSVFSWQKRRA